MVAEWYLDDLYELLDNNDIQITLTISPDEAIELLGNDINMTVHSQMIYKNTDHTDGSSIGTNEEYSDWEYGNESS